MWFISTWVGLSGCVPSEASGGGKPSATAQPAARDLVIEAQAGGHFRLVNRSRHDLDVLPPLDGSMHKRHPKVGVEFRDASGKPVPFDPAGCGLTNPLSETDFVTVKPGGSIALLPSTWLTLTPPDGASEMRLSYSTEGFPEADLAPFQPKRLPMGKWTSDWVSVRSCEPLPKDGAPCFATELCAESPHSYLECTGENWSRVTELYDEP